MKPRRRMSRLLAAGTSSGWAPLVATEADSPSPIELHALGFEQEPLVEFFAELGAPADLAPSVDHAVPGDGGAGWKGVHRIANLPRVSLEAGECGDLAIGRDPAAGNAPDHGVDASVTRAQRHAPGRPTSRPGAGIVL